MPEHTIYCCGTIQQGNSKQAPTPRQWECRICGEVNSTWPSVYGPTLPPGYAKPERRKSPWEYTWIEQEELTKRLYAEQLNNGYKPKKSFLSSPLGAVVGLLVMTIIPLLVMLPVAMLLDSVESNGPTESVYERENFFP
jgi:hypothetical protein